MDGHSEFYMVSLQLWIVPPQESQEVTMFHVNLYLMKHALDVTHKGDSFLAESAQNSGKVVRQIWSLE